MDSSLFALSDPVDVGRTYEFKTLSELTASQEKGGVSYILKQSYGLALPEKMREEVGYSVKDVSDKEHKELSPAWVYQIFEDKYINDNSIFSVSDTLCSRRMELLQK